MMAEEEKVDCFIVLLILRVRGREQMSRTKQHSKRPKGRITFGYDSEEKRRFTKSGAADREVMIHEEVELDTCVRDMVEDAADVVSKRVSSIAVEVPNQISWFFLPPPPLQSGLSFFCVPTEREAGRLSLCARLTYAVNVKLPPAS